MMTPSLSLCAHIPSPLLSSFHLCSHVFRAPFNGTRLQLHWKHNKISGASSTTTNRVCNKLTIEIRARTTPLHFPHLSSVPLKLILILRWAALKGFNGNLCFMILKNFVWNSSSVFRERMSKIVEKKLSITDLIVFICRKRTRRRILSNRESSLNYRRLFSTLLILQL